MYVPLAVFWHSMYRCYTFAHIVEKIYLSIYLIYLIYLSIYLSIYIFFLCYPMPFDIASCAPSPKQVPQDRLPPGGENRVMNCSKAMGHRLFRSARFIYPFYRLLSLCLSLSVPPFST